MLTRVIKSKLFKDTGTYAVINILDKAIPFLIIPILTRVISKEEMGHYTLYQALFHILVPILTVSMDSSILVNYYKLSKEEFAKYFSSGISLGFIFYVFFFVIGFVFSSSISKVAGIPVFWVQITMAIVLLQFLSQLRKNLWRVKRQPFAYGLYSIPLTFAKNILGLYFVLVLGYGWEGIIWGHFIAQFVFSLIAVGLFAKEKLFKLYILKEHVKDLLSVGAPISIHKISAWLSMSLNRLIINSILGKAATGSYGVGATFGIILTVIEDAVNKAYVPYLFEKLKDFSPKNALKIVQLSYVYYAIFIIMSIVMIIVGYWGVGYIFGNDYTDTRVFLIPIILSALVNGLYKLHVNFILFTKKTHIVATTTIICGILNIGIAYVLIYKHGLIGAAYSALIIQVIMYLLTIYFSNKQYSLPWFYFIFSEKQKN